MVCKFYKKQVCAGDKTCTNGMMCNTKYCPFTNCGKFLDKKAASTCRGYVAKVGTPAKENTPQILKSIMGGVHELLSGRYGSKVIVTIENDDGTFKARIPIIRNPSGGWMTNKVFCRVNGCKRSKELRELIKKYRDGRRI